MYFSTLVGPGSKLSAIFGTVSGTPGSATVKSIISVFTALLIFASFGAICILLVIRLVGLWVLTMLSPAAYALNILPYTQQYAKQWWTYFLKYLIWGPVAMFFLYIGQTLAKVSAIQTGNGTLDALFIGIFFWAALFVCKQAGMIGSGT